jgi:hypothetical protein
MPWVETEELFKSTLKAAVEATSPHDGIPKNLKIVDLGEAGRQEIWQSGSKCIQKTIAKHGGKQNSDPRHGSQVTRCCARFGSRSVFSLSHNNDWLCSTRISARISICGMFELSTTTVPTLRPRPDQHAAFGSGFLVYPCSHRLCAALPDSLVSFKANTSRPQWNDAICATCSYNSATIRLRGSCHAIVAPWYPAMEVSTVRKATTHWVSVRGGFASLVHVPWTCSDDAAYSAPPASGTKPTVAHCVGL